MDDVIFIKEVIADADDESREFLKELLLEMMEGY